MTKLMEQVLAAANQLPASDQDVLAAVWLGDVRDGVVTDDLRHDLEARLREHEANPSDVLSWEQVQARVAERFAR